MELRYIIAVSALLSYPVPCMTDTTLQIHRHDAQHDPTLGCVPSPSSCILRDRFQSNPIKIGGRMIYRLHKSGPPF